MQKNIAKTYVKEHLCFLLGVLWSWVTHKTYVSINERMEKGGIYIYTHTHTHTHTHTEAMEYSSTIKKDKVLPSVTT